MITYVAFQSQPADVLTQSEVPGFFFFLWSVLIEADQRNPFPYLWKSMLW